MQLCKLTMAIGFGLILVNPGRAQYGDISDLKIAKPEDKVDVRPVPPPKNAVVLFDGKNLDGWVKRDGKSKPAWRLLEDGIVQTQGGDIITRENFDGAFTLHVE